MISHKAEIFQGIFYDILNLTWSKFYVITIMCAYSG